MGLSYSKGDTDFGDPSFATGGFSSDTQTYGIYFEWDFHAPVSHEIRGLRNDERLRHHEATVEQEAEKEQAELVADAEEKAHAGRFDWLKDDLEIWFAVLIGVLGAAYGVGRWIESIKQKAEKK